MEAETECLNVKRITFTFGRSEIIEALAKLKGFTTYIDYDHSIELFNGDHSMGIMPYVKIIIDIPQTNEDD